MKAVPAFLAFARPSFVLARRPLLMGAGFAAAAVLLTRLAFINVLFPVAILYAAAFWLIAWKRPGIALMLVVAGAPFQNDLSGGGGAKFSIAETNLVLILPVLYVQWLMRRVPPRVGPILIPVLLYFGVCLSTGPLHWHGTSAIISLGQMFLYLIVTVAVFASFPPTPQDYWVGFYALALVGVFLALAGLATNYTFIGLNKNGIAASLACSFLVNVELLLTAKTIRQQRLLGVALLVIAAGLLFSLSRGAWIGTAAGVLFIFGLRGRLPQLLKISLILAPLLLVFWFSLPPSSREYAVGFGQEHYNIKLRFDSINLAEDYFNQSPLYGMGVGLRKDYDATNVLLLTLAETGILGVAALLLIHLAFFRMIWRAQQRTARTEPLFSLLALGGALILNKFMHGLVDHYWSRGALMIVWAAAGMATRAYYMTERRTDFQPHLDFVRGREALR